MNQIEHPAAQLMILNRLSAADVAAQVGIRRGSLYLILQRQRRCSWEVAKKLGAVLGLDPAVIMDVPLAKPKKAAK